MSRELDNVSIDQWGGIQLCWSDTEGNSDSSYDMLLEHDVRNAHFGDIDMLAIHIVELRAEIEQLRSQIHGLSAHNDAGAIHEGGESATPGPDANGASGELGSVPRNRPSGDGYPYG
jgi:hypothetical protein